jgi:hypothetical protein
MLGGTARDAGSDLAKKAARQAAEEAMRSGMKELREAGIKEAWRQERELVLEHAAVYQNPAMQIRVRVIQDCGGGCEARLDDATLFCGPA